MDNNLVNISTLKDGLSEYVRMAETGSAITTITVNGRDAARLVPATDDYDPRPLTSDGGGWTYVGGAHSYPPDPFSPRGFVARKAARRGGDPAFHLDELVLGHEDEFKASDGLRYLLEAWVINPEEGRERAHLWRHLLSEAAVLAVPYATYRTPAASCSSIP